MGYPKAIEAIRNAERNLNAICDSPSVGEICRRDCLIGGMEVIAEVLRAYGQRPLTRGGPRLGIIISPFEDCPRGFEEIFVETPRNRKVKICRLDEKHRKKWAPKGKPATPGATKSALRRKRGFPRGLTIRPIQRGGGE